MDNVDWVKPYINRLFNSQTDKSGDLLLQEKLNYINIPFYKYCYVCESSSRNENTIDYNIENFKNNELFFQTPDKFNDPFDCFLGFSQTQAIRDLIIAELRKRKKYNPEMRKAVNQFFSDEAFTISFSDTIYDENFVEILDFIVPLIINNLNGDTLLVESVITFLKSLLINNESRELFKKLITNTLTIKDKQSLIDLMYQNEVFREYLANQLSSENKDWIIDAVKRDMKLNVETTPDSVFSEGNSESFAALDFLKVFVDIFQENSVLTELSDIKEQFYQLSNEAMEKSRKIIASQCRVTCLSEKMDSPLMWSHYANKHYGFCLEYDFTHTLIRRYPDLAIAQMMLFPVIYSSKRPLLSKAFFNPQSMLQYMKTKTLSPGSIINMIQGLLYKSEDWKYEHEWRIISINSDKPTLKLPPARKVFLGQNMEVDAKEKVIEIAKSKKIPVYQMMLAADQYKFDYYRIL